jgi:hypothetical protein
VHHPLALLRYLCIAVGAAYVCLSTPAHAQSRPTVIAVSGELNATRLSRSVAQRTGSLLGRTRSDFTIVSADTVASLLDATMYKPHTPALPEDLREVCRQFRAAAIIDIMTFRERQEVRAIAFRLVRLHSPSRGVRFETALLIVGEAFASTADSVASQLAPQIAESLRKRPMGSAADTASALHCLDFNDSADSATQAPRAPSNPRCC